MIIMMMKIIIMMMTNLMTMMMIMGVECHLVVGLLHRCRQPVN